MSIYENRAIDNLVEWLAKDENRSVKARDPFGDGVFVQVYLCDGEREANHGSNIPALAVQCALDVWEKCEGRDHE